MENEQVNPPAAGDQVPAGLGWRSALPDEFKEHEFVKTFQKPGDFVKAAIDIKTDRDTLKSQIDSLPTRPEKADGYEFDGDTLDPKVVNWAKNTFFEAGLNKDQAKKVSAAWNAFIGQTIAEETKQRETERAKAETDLKAELGDKYDSSIELVRRVWKNLSNSEFDAFVNETKIGNDPRLIRFMINIAKKTGEDVSPSSSPNGQKPASGIVYDKSPELYRK
jgi:hypothetical protein